MRVYTVHFRDGGSDDGLKFVPEGFSFWAFALSWLWALRHGLWLVAGALIVAELGVAALVHALEIHPATNIVFSLAISVLAGLFGQDARRWTLARRGYVDMGVVAEKDEDAATRRFLNAHPVIGERMTAIGMGAPA